MLGHEVPGQLLHPRVLIDSRTAIDSRALIGEIRHLMVY